MEEVEEKKSLKPFFGGMFFLLVLVLLGVYWFVPIGELEFISTAKNTNFSLSNSSNMQFYNNLRYPDKEISYKISDECSLKKKNDAQEALDILENLTVLNFYEVNSGEEITISCDDEVHYNEEYFIAGEGGPTNIVSTDNFNVIKQGMVLLIEESNCEFPNVAIHELLHALGFKHSTNKANIMYNISKCSQRIGDDIPSLINELYSVESLADLEIKKSLAKMSGRYLDLNLTIQNQGLQKSGSAVVIIYADEENVKEFDLNELDVGEGVEISLKNVLINQINVEEISVEIESVFEELSKKNNKIELKVKT